MVSILHPSRALSAGFSSVCLVSFLKEAPKVELTMLHVVSSIRTLELVLRVIITNFYFLRPRYAVS